MTGNKKILKLLYRSFDDRLSEKEQSLLAEALENSPGLCREKEQIESQRQRVTNSAVQSFKPFFVQRVMEQVKALEGKTNDLAWQMFYESLVSVFRRVAIAGAAVSIIMFIFNLGLGPGLSPEETFTMSDLTLREILAIF